MAKALQPKAEIRNTHPLLAHRLAASRGGWSQCPCTLKTITCKGWPKLPSDEDAIHTRQEWRSTRLAGTAVRVVGDLAVYDSDITIPEVSDAILDDLFDLDNEAYNAAIMRDSGRVSLALFFRTVVPFRQYKTHSYTAHAELIQPLLDAYAMPETSEEEHDLKVNAIRALMVQLDAQKMEIYGPLARGRYFQYEGPHSEGRDYRTGERAPWNTAVADLPLLPLEAGELANRAEAIFERMLTRIPEPVDAGGDVVYDLTPDTLFYAKSSDSGRIEDLTAGLARGAENGIRGCLSSTLAGSRSQANCNLYVTLNGRTVVTEWSADGRLHYMVEEQPPPHVELDDAARATLAALQPPADDPPADAAPPPQGGRKLKDIVRDQADAQQTYLNAIVWMLEHVAYHAAAFKGLGGAVSIHPDGEFPAPLKMTSLREAMKGHGYFALSSPRSTVPKFHNPVDAWSMSPNRVQVAGVRMRPELPAPLFRDDGALYINRYQQPAHASAGGTLEPFWLRLHAMIPEPAEAAWFINWMRLLVQKPHWRMVAVAMVARDNGSGRGLLAETLQRVLGEQFVVSMPYANISGGAKFNAEVEGRLLLHVNEAAPADGHKWAGRNAAREALKDFVEPNHNVPFRVEPKGIDAYYTRAAVSTLIFTNNVNGLPLDSADRRFAVLVNGPQMSAAEIERYRAWMENDVNIGALFRWLRDTAIETNRQVFDPYMAPHFTGRDRMIDAGKTTLDHVWDAAVAKLETATDLYTMSQVIAVARHLAKAHTSDFDDMARRHTFTNGHRIGVKRPKEINWRVRYGAEEDNREPVFAFNERSAGTWTHALLEDIKKQLDKAQGVVDAPTKAFNKLLHLVKKQNKERDDGAE